MSQRPRAGDLSDHLSPKKDHEGGGRPGRVFNSTLYLDRLVRGKLRVSADGPVSWIGAYRVGNGSGNTPPLGWDDKCFKVW